MEKVCLECSGRLDFYGSSRRHKNVWLYACHKCNILWRLCVNPDSPKKTEELKKSSRKLSEWNPTLDDF